MHGRRRTSIALLALHLAACGPQPPSVLSFTATPANLTEGDAAVLAWQVRGTSAPTIEPGVGAVSGASGSVEVAPAATTTYTLRAVNAAGEATAQVTVTVEPAGPETAVWGESRWGDGVWGP